MVELRTPRVRDLSTETFEHSWLVARTQFRPPCVALRVAERLDTLVRLGAAFGVILDVTVPGEGLCVGGAAWLFMNKDAQLGLREVPLEGLDDWIAEDLLRPPSVLSREEIGRANAAGELDMFLLYFKADDEHLSDRGRRYVVQELMFHAFPRGYHLRSLTGRVRCRGQITSGLRAGVHLLRPESVSPGADEFLPFPVLLYIDRERVEFASWVAGAFIWTRPRFQFNPGARRTLTLAARGYRDEDIAAECGVSASTIKKRWDSIFERVSRTSPDFFHEPADRGARQGRGPEKRGLLLHYIAAHPEELRPYS